MYLGTFNGENSSTPLGLLARYKKLPLGVFHIITKKLGLPLLLVIIIGNLIYISRKKLTSGKYIITLSKWTAVFSSIYLILLPLGGYRAYRENIIRYDTFMPVTICIIFLFALSTFHLIKTLNFKEKKIYIPVIAAVLLIFTVVDTPSFQHHYCEKENLITIQKSPHKTVLLPNNCKTLDWQISTDPKRSTLTAKLLVKWNLTSEEKLFYQK